MSCDFAVWYPQKRLSNQEAGELYVRLCESDSRGVVPHPAVDQFYTELTTRHPEIDTIPEEKVGDFDYCPWSCALDRSPGHVIMCCVWSKATYVDRLVQELARKHGLALYDPQSERVTYPDGSTGSKAGSSRWAFWILSPFALLGAGTFVYSARLAPSGSDVALYVLASLCGVMAAACFRQALK